MYGTEIASVFSCDIGVKRFLEEGRMLAVELLNRGIWEGLGGVTESPLDVVSGKTRVKSATREA